MRLTVGQLRQVIKEEVARVRVSRTGNRRRLRENALSLYLSMEDNEGGSAELEEFVSGVYEEFLRSPPAINFEVTIEAGPNDQEEGVVTFENETQRALFLAIAAIQEPGAFNERPGSGGDSSTGGMLGKMPMG